MLQMAVVAVVVVVVGLLLLLLVMWMRARLMILLMLLMLLQLTPSSTGMHLTDSQTIAQRNLAVLDLPSRILNDVLDTTPCAQCRFLQKFLVVGVVGLVWLATGLVVGGFGGLGMLMKSVMGDLGI
jgi:hypothetical protein